MVSVGRSVAMAIVWEECSHGECGRSVAMAIVWE